MEFARLGGLSPVKYKATDTGFEGHKPPVKHGIFAFPWPYIETYLCLYDEAHEAELKNRGFRKFEFDGMLFHHLKAADDVAWTMSDIVEYAEFLKEFKHKLTKEIHADPYINKHTMPIHDPFKRGLGGWFSRDSLEVFIPRTEMGRIR
jgi:hypothetical protein